MMSGEKKNHSVFEKAYGIEILADADVEDGKTHHDVMVLLPI